MRLDSLLAFVPLGAPLSLAAGASPTLTSQVIDLLGTGVGTAPANIIGTATVFGEDPGIGMFRPELMIAMGSANAAGGTSVNVQLQYAVDSGVGGNYQPGTWNTVVETGALLTANLTANQVLARFPWLPAFPPGTLPRFLRLAFVEVGTFTAGAIAFAIPTFVRDDQSNKFAAKNYKVS